MLGDMNVILRRFVRHLNGVCWFSPLTCIGIIYLYFIYWWHIWEWWDRNVKIEKIDFELSKVFIIRHFVADSIVYSKTLFCRNIIMGTFLFIFIFTLTFTVYRILNPLENGFVARNCQSYEEFLDAWFNINNTFLDWNFIILLGVPFLATNSGLDAEMAFYMGLCV